MTPYGPQASTLPQKKTGPIPIGVSILGAIVLGLVVAMLAMITGGCGSPKAVTTALQGEKKDYVGKWETKKGETRSADLAIDATGELSYNESSTLRASRGQQGNYECDNQHITAFEGDDIVVGRALRMKVTRKPHVVGDQIEMTVNTTHTFGGGEVSFVRGR